MGAGTPAVVAPLILATVPDAGGARAVAPHHPPPFVARVLRRFAGGAPPAQRRSSRASDGATPQLTGGRTVYPQSSLRLPLARA